MLIISTRAVCRQGVHNPSPRMLRIAVKCGSVLERSNVDSGGRGAVAGMSVSPLKPISSRVLSEAGVSPHRAVSGPQRLQLQAGGFRLTPQPYAADVTLASRPVSLNGMLSMATWWGNCTSLAEHLAGHAAVEPYNVAC